MGQPAIGIPNRLEYAPDRVTIQLALDDLIREAFELKNFELIGPKSLDDDMFLLQAAMPVGTSKGDVRLMLQQALVERFGLKYHREPREIAVYALVPGKNGVKLQPADDANHRQLKPVEMPSGTIHAHVSYGPGQFFAAAMTLDDFAQQLQNVSDLELPVVNSTGLDGEYKFDMHWPPTEDSKELMTGKDSGFTRAVQDQLGLQLAKRRTNYNVLVVDHIDRAPSAN